MNNDDPKARERARKREWWHRQKLANPAFVERNRQRDREQKRKVLGLTVRTFDAEADGEAYTALLRLLKSLGVRKHTRKRGNLVTVTFRTADFVRGKISR